MEVGVHSGAHFQVVGPNRSGNLMKGMKEPLILLFTRDGDFAQSVRDALFETGATVLVARDVRDGLQIV
jgi:hypothetical protein